MKKEKLISSVLAVSVLMSLCSCSGDDKTVLAIAEKYAEAVVSFETDDIAELMEDSSAEAELERMEETYKENPVFEQAYQAILGSMSYTIDSKSVQSSKKDKKASVDITFTLTDYDTVFDDVYDDGGTLDDYIAALKDDDGDNVIEITQTVEFVYKRDRWLIKDKRFKNLDEIYSFIEDIRDYGWGNFKALSESEYRSVLRSVFNADDNSIYEDDYGDCREIGYLGSDKYLISMKKYKDPRFAGNDFSGLYYELQPDIENSKNKDRYTYSYTGDTGYFLFKDLYVQDFGAIYGGAYLKDDVVVMVLVIDGSQSEHEKIDQFLAAISYPKPF